MKHVLSFWPETILYSVLGRFDHAWCDMDLYSWDDLTQRLMTAGNDRVLPRGQRSFLAGHPATRPSEQ